MSFNGAGTFSRITPAYSGSTSWQQEEAGGFGKVATRHDVHDQDIASGLSNLITKDGQTTITANISIGGNNLVNVGSGTSRSSLVTVGQYQDGGKLWAGTTTGAAGEYIASPTLMASTPVEGMEVYFIAHQDNDLNESYFSFSGQPHNQIVRYRLPATSAGIRLKDIRAGHLIHVIYTSVAGGQWVMASEEYQQWQTWTPTLSTFGGTPATITPTSWFIRSYLVKDNICYWNLAFTASGSGAGYLALTASLPVPCVNSDHLSTGFGNGAGTLRMALVLTNQGAIQFSSDQTTFFIATFSETSLIMGGQGFYEVA